MPFLFTKVWNLPELLEIWPQSNTKDWTNTKPIPFKITDIQPQPQEGPRTHFSLSFLYDKWLSRF